MIYIRKYQVQGYLNNLWGNCTQGTMFLIIEKINSAILSILQQSRSNIKNKLQENQWDKFWTNQNYREQE